LRTLISLSSEKSEYVVDTVTTLAMLPRKEDMYMQIKHSIGEPANPAENQELFSPDEFGRLVGLCGTTVRRMAKAGKLRMFRVNCRVLRIPKSELERFRDGDSPQQVQP